MSSALHSAVWGWGANLTCFCPARKFEARKNIIIFSISYFTKVPFSFFFLVSYASLILNRILLGSF